MLPITAGSAMDWVAAVMNDTARQQYTDDVILPYMQLAYSDLKTELQDYNIPVTNTTSGILTVDQGMLDIGGPTGPALPVDLVEILSINERTAGTADDFAMMTRRQFLPLTQQITAYLQVWSWQGQVIKFIGSTSDIEVKINYIGANLGDIVNQNTQLGLFNIKGYLAYRTGGHCSYFVGEDVPRSQLLYGLATQELDKILSINIKSQQSIRTRRRPFRSSFKSYGQMR